jgi:circadian clock protein KaiC
MIRREIESFKPRRLVMDSVSEMERVSTVRNFPEFVIGLTSYVKQEEICSLFTSTTPKISGGDSVTEAHISTITDAIVLLRYVEINDILRRGIAVIKMRGSQHDKQIREFTIDSEGLHIGEPFRNVQNIVLGVPSISVPSESEQLEEMFQK